MIAVVQKAFSVKGRLSRLGYWRWQLALMLIAIVGFVGAAALTMSGLPRGVAALCFALMGLAVGIAIAAAVRRLHDRGRSAAWLIPFMVIPWGLNSWCAYVVQSWTLAQDSAAVLSALAAVIVSLLLNLWSFVEIGLLRGQAGPNRFGPPV